FLNYTPNINIELYKERYNNALIVQYGFKRMAISNSNNDYFNNTLLKKFFLHEVINISNDNICKIGNKYILYIDKNLSKPYLMLRNKEYDIIALRNNERYIISFLNGKLKREKIERLI
ncbi:MAG: hypothetical protein ACRC7R_08245, partial [Sarcina sp.]